MAVNTLDPLRILRSSSPGARPTGRQSGEIYANLADRKMGFIDADGTPRDMAGIDAANTFTAAQTFNGPSPAVRIRAPNLATALAFSGNRIINWDGEAAGDHEYRLGRYSTAATSVSFAIYGPNTADKRAAIESSGRIFGAQVDLHGAGPDLRFTETDQASPSGQWRMVGQGGSFTLQRAGGAGFTSLNDIFRADQDNSFNILRPTTFADSVSIAGLLSQPGKPFFHATRSTAQPGAADTWSVLRIDTIQTDVGNRVSLPNNRFTAPVAGVYLFGASATVQLTGAAPTSVRLGFAVNDAANPTNYQRWAFSQISANATIECVLPLLLAAGDTVQARWYCATNGTDLAGTNTASFWGVLL